MHRADARRRFAEARVGRMATIRTDRTPDLVPVVFAVDGDLVYSAVDPKPKTARVAPRTYWRRFPAVAQPVLNDAFVPAHRCGAVPEFHRVPSCDA